ncbi:MAG: CYTH domain protein [Salinisphaeraceae bacterium]|nr:CYTH domain protein [Salinisphaeraceae bacterium]
MGVEIERKFLLAGDAWRREVCRVHEITQGYLAQAQRSSVRIRLQDDQANLNIKSAEAGAQRLEYEYPLPPDQAREMLDRLCLPGRIAKRRHIVSRGDHVWEIDEFLEHNSGLVVAEIELAEPNEAFDRPAWLGPEVTDLHRYYNHALSHHPFADWTEADRRGP